ncbi:hypothetical protein AAMO2058_001433800 [Amorphochlora amoebiformis]
MAMEGAIELHRTEINYIGGSNNRKCLDVFTSSKGKLQKVVFGGKSGVVDCFTVKNGNIQQVFKSQSKKEVTALCLGGSKGNKDKVFVAQGHRIRAMKKKGKEFFAFETALTEDILGLFVQNPNVYTACEYTLNRFEVTGSRAVEKDFYMANDQIHAMCALPDVTESDKKGVSMALGCADRYLRIVNGSKQIIQAKLPGSVTSVEVQRSSGKMEGKERKGYFPILYGTESGLIGQLFISPDFKIAPGFAIRNDNKKGGINAIDTVDVYESGVLDLVVARDDGFVEVYELGEKQPVCKYTNQETTESIMTLAHGNIVTMHQDIIYSTIRKLDLDSLPTSTENISKARGKEINSLAGTKLKSKKASVECEEEKLLKAQIEKLESELKQIKTNFLAVSSQEIATSKQFHINHSMKIDQQEATYTISIQIEMEIDVVVIHSDVNILLMDNENSDAILTISPTNQSQGNAVLATYKCENSSKRVLIKLRTIEGRFGNISVYVIPKANPKTSQRIQIPIKPLSLHQKLEYKEVVKLLENIPTSGLVITGGFSLAQVHGWVSTVFPAVPTRLKSERVELGYRSCFTGSSIRCNYVKGKAEFESDNVTALSIIKEVISREATKRRVQISISLDIKPQSVFHMLKMLRPQLDHHFSKNRQHKLLPALKEIERHEEEELSHLSQEYLDILAKGNEIKEEVQSNPKHLEFLKGIVIDLFVDKNKLIHGQEKSSEAVDKALENYNFEFLLGAFK